MNDGEGGGGWSGGGVETRAKIETGKKGEIGERYNDNEEDRNEKKMMVWVRTTGPEGETKRGGEGEGGVDELGCYREFLAFRSQSVPVATNFEDDQVQRDVAVRLRRVRGKNEERPPRW